MKREFLFNSVRQFERYSNKHEFDSLSEAEQLANIAIAKMLYDARREKNDRIRLIKFDNIEKLCIWYLHLYAE